MKHLESFDNYNNYEETNEGVIGSFISFILSPIPIVILNLLSPKIIEKSFENVINVYFNINRLIDAIRIIVNDDQSRFTDTEKRKAKKRLKSLEKVLKKWPTLEDYKNKIKKTAILYNIRNYKYLQRRIELYQPVELTRTELIKELKNITRDAGQLFPLEDHRRPINTFRQAIDRDNDVNINDDDLRGGGIEI